MAGLTRFDVIGVAGNRRRVANQPAWAFIDDRFTWDVKSNLSGRVAHGKDAFGEMSNFGTVPAECELLDGVFLATKKSSLKERNVRFDTQFDFHFYDMDFCRSAKKAGLKLGTWTINLTHQSGGAFGSQQWREKYLLYIDKWEADVNEKARSCNLLWPHLKQQSPSVRNTSMETDKLTKALVNLAQDNETTGNHIAAACLYAEALKLTPKDANINYRLGLIEVSLKGAAGALPRGRTHCVLSATAPGAPAARRASPCAARFSAEAPGAPAALQGASRPMLREREPGEARSANRSLKAYGPEAWLRARGS